ncbi:Cell growth regulator with RING finger domain protein 1 [Mizuhopecten yessoensis]|uniref:Cell growth regulator with RING finger domain protein 1 n=1 Tax=Mizuhopecten yessoensis TaxID=6573 RepID=A0A210PW10_MIZYE|nr:Cell growth regulator with RING finger domain protein 1 [Mizuhopecten yessoensis]
MADELSVMLFWLNNENIFMNLNSTSVQQVNLAVERCVTDMVNPFSVKMRPNELSSLKDGLHIQLSLLKKCILQVYWGIDLEEFHKAMQAPWQHILHNLHTKSWLEGYTLFRNEKKELNPCDSRHEHLQCPGEIVALGEPPRKKYPAMVITYLPGSQEEENSTDPTIVAVFSVIHLKDNTCQQDSHILNQYMKTSNQGVFTLQERFTHPEPPLYISTSPESETSRTSSQPVTQANNTSTPSSSPDPHYSRENEQRGESQDQDSVQQSQVLSDESGESEACVHSLGPSKDVNFPDPSTGICSNCGKTTNIRKCLCVECNREASSCTDPLFSTESVEELQGSQENWGEADSSVCLDTPLVQESDRDFNLQDDQQEECIVCQAELVALALLPCRHTCVCSSCFTQLDRCPMCRGYIESYFRVRRNSEEENAVTGEDTPPDSLISTAHGSMWERLNSRLNTFLGFS